MKIIKNRQDKRTATRKGGCVMRIVLCFVLKVVIPLLLVLLLVRVLL